jgi:hypothetical protein
MQLTHWVSSAGEVISPVAVPVLAGFKFSVGDDDDDALWGRERPAVDATGPISAAHAMQNSRATHSIRSEIARFA